MYIPIGTYYGTTNILRAGRVLGMAQTLSALKEKEFSSHLQVTCSTCFYRIFTKLVQHVFEHNVLAWFDNQPNRVRKFWFMAIELSKIAKINIVRSLSLTESSDLHETC